MSDPGVLLPYNLPFAISGTADRMFFRDGDNTPRELTTVDLLGAGAIPSVKDFSAIGDGLTSSQDAIVDACAAAYAGGFDLWWPAGLYLTTASIPRLHSVRHWGPGRILREGNVFYPNPRTGQINTLFIGPAGGSSNDGLSATQAMTPQTAADALANYGPALDGRWTLYFTAGTTVGTMVVPSGLRMSYPLMIKGPDVGGHPNVPTAIWQPTATSDDILTVSEGRGWYTIQDIKFDGATTGLAISVNGGVRVAATNVHMSGCLNGVVNQHNAMFSPSGGIWTGRGKAVAGGLAFFSTYAATHGFSGTGAADGVQVVDWDRGLLINEGAQGHLDGAQILNCGEGLTFKRGAGACNTQDVAIDGCDVAVVTHQPWFNNGITFGATTANTLDVQSRGGSPEEDFCTSDHSVHTERLIESAYGISHTGTVAETQVFEFTDIRAWMIGEAGHTARVFMAFSNAALVGTCGIRIYLYDGSTEDLISLVSLPIGTEDAVVESRINFSAVNAQRGITWGSYKAGATQGALCGAKGTGAIDTRHTACTIRVKLTLSNAADTATISWREIYGTFAG